MSNTPKDDQLPKGHVIVSEMADSYLVPDDYAMFAEIEEYTAYTSPVYKMLTEPEVPKSPYENKICDCGAASISTYHHYQWCSVNG